MERFMEIISLDNKLATRDKIDFQPRNHNFRRPPVPQIRKREKRIPTDHPVRPPFQNNYTTENFEESPEDIHFFDLEDRQIYLTKEEHDQFMDANDKFMQDNDDMLLMENKGV